MITLRVFENPDSFFEKSYSGDTPITIGRSEQCDLVLRSRRVSRDHCRIVLENGSWIVQDSGSQNGIRLNHARTDNSILSHGDSLTIGDFRLEIELPQPEPEDNTLQNEDLDRTILAVPEEDPDKTVVLGMPPPVAGFPEPGGKKQVLAGFFDSTPRKILAGAAGVFVLFVMVLFVKAMRKSESPPPETVVVKEETEKSEAMMDMETRHRIDFYLRSGAEKYNSGDYNESLVRFQSVLSLEPANETARGYITAIQQRLAERDAQRQALAREEEERKARVSEILSSARRAMDRHDTRKAEALMAEAVFLAPDNPAVLDLNAEIAKELDREKAEMVSRRKAQEARLSDLKALFDKGQAAYDQGNYYQTVTVWEKALAMGLDAPQTAHIKSALPHVKKSLEKSAETNYGKGLLYYQKKEYAEAVNYLSKAEKTYPGYKDARQLITRSVEALEANAKQLFQEGLVYEGIGKQDKAREKWRQVMEAIPIETNDYYKRARAKLQ